MKVNKSDYDPQQGFLYYVTFKPNMEVGDETVSTRVPVTTAMSISETGDLTDVTFTVPKQCRNDNALSYLQKERTVNLVAERVMITVPEKAGDAVVSAPGKLDLDAAGRIVGMEIQFQPGGRTDA